MATNDKPAILGAAEIETIRASLAGHIGSLEKRRTIEPSSPHVDALTAGDVDAEALGLTAWMARVDEDFWKERGRDLGPIRDAHRQSWEILGDDERSRYGRIGSALYTLGRAAGRSEGEAERTTAEARLRKLVGDDAGTLADVMFGAASEIERLTAELAEALTTLASVREQHEEERADMQREIAESESMVASAAADHAAARAEGAREEREVLVAALRAEIGGCLTPGTEYERALRLAIGVVEAGDESRARGEGGPKESPPDSEIPNSGMERRGAM